MDEIYIQKQLDQMPEEAKRALLSMRVHERIVDLSRLHGLPEEQTRGLETELVLLVLGVVSFADFVSNLSKNLSLDEPDALALAEGINTNILIPLEEETRRIRASGATPKKIDTNTIRRELKQSDVNTVSMLIKEAMNT